MPMKTKKLSKKLTLNKATITRLDDQEMNGAVKGGDTGYFTRCYAITCPNTCYVSCSCVICPW